MSCLLLDVDGVIVRDRLLLAHVKHNATRYLQKKLPDCKDPAAVNRSLYMAYGHTARGLTTGFGIDSSDYNEQVYDNSLMNHLVDVIERPEFKKDAEYISSLINKGFPVTLFSNAPYKWVNLVAMAISDEVKVRCPGPDPSKSHMKPEFAFYQEFDTCLDYYFVDDSLKNLGVVRKLKNWHPIHFNEGNHDPRLSIPQISRLQDLTSLEIR
jgi:hypothetical protein